MCIYCLISKYTRIPILGYLVYRYLVSSGAMMGPRMPPMWVRLFVPIMCREFQKESWGYMCRGFPKESWGVRDENFEVIFGLISGVIFYFPSKQLLHISINEKSVFNYNGMHYRSRVCFNLCEKRTERQTKRFKLYRWTKSLRKAALKHHYNNYGYCTLQQQLSKKNIRQAKKRK